MTQLAVPPLSAVRGKGSISLEDSIKNAAAFAPGGAQSTEAPPRTLSLEDSIKNNASPEILSDTQAGADMVMKRLEWYRDNGKVSFEQASRPFLPGIRDADGLNRVGRSVWSGYKLASGDYHIGDVDNFAYMLWRAELEDNKGFWRQVVEGIATIPAFGFEVAVTAVGTGPAAPAVWTFKKVAVSATLKKMKKEAKELAIKNLGINMAKGVLRGTRIVGMQTLKNPQMVGHMTARQMASNFEIDAEEGEALNFLVAEDAKGFWEAMGKGFTQTAIELGTERLGVFPEKARKAIAALPDESKLQLVRSGLVNWWLKRKPNSKPTDMVARVLSAGRWHGLATEMGEELTGNVLNAALVEQDMKSALPSAEELAMMGLTLGGFQLGVTGIRKALGVPLSQRADLHRKQQAGFEALGLSGERAKEVTDATQKPVRAQTPEPEEDPVEAQQAAEAEILEQGQITKEQAEAPLAGAVDLKAKGEAEGGRPRSTVTGTYGSTVTATYGGAIEFHERQNELERGQSGVSTVFEAAKTVSERAEFNLEKLGELQDSPSRRAFENEFGLSIPRESDRQAVANMALIHSQDLSRDVQSGMKGLISNVSKQTKADLDNPILQATEEEIAFANQVTQENVGVTFKAVEPESREDKDVAEYLRSFALKPVFAEFSGDPTIDYNGFAIADLVLIRPGQGGNALWGLLAHEMSHGTQLDRMKDLPEDLIQRYGQKYVDQSVGPIRDAVLNDPDLFRREAVATMFQDFMSDPKFRAQVKTKDPINYNRFRDRIAAALGGYTPKSEAARRVLEELRSWEDTKALARQFGIPIRGSKDVIDSFIRVAQNNAFARSRKVTKPLAELLTESPKAGQVAAAAQKGTSVPPEFEFDEPQLNDFMEENRGLNRPSILDAIKQDFSEIGSLFRRARNLPEFFESAGARTWDAAREGIRLARSLKGFAEEEASRMIRSILDPMTEEQRVLFSNYIATIHQEWMLANGQGMRMPFTNPDSVQRNKKRFEQAIAQSPGVQKALQRRREEVGTLVDELVARGLLPKEARESSDVYFHMQIHAKKEIDARFGTRRVTPTKRSFQHKRINEQNEEYNPDLKFNTDYTESEAEWMTEAIVELEKAKYYQKYFKEPYDRKPALIKEARKQRGIAEAAGLPQEQIDAITWQSLVPAETHQIWHPPPGNYFYTAMTLPHKILEDLLKNNKILAISKDDLQQVTAMGLPKGQIVIPHELAAELNEMNKARHQALPARYLRNAHRYVKGYLTAFGPKLISFTARQLVGDVDASIAMGTNIKTAGLRLKSSLVEMTRFYGGEILQLPADLRSAIQYGVIDAGIGAAEIPGAESMRLLNKFMKDPSLWYKAPKTVIRAFRDFQVIRESALRYTLYKDYLDKMRKGEDIYYGGTNRKTVELLQKAYGNEVAAAHMSREFLGDYRNISVMGDWLRSYLYPFWAFQELNARRYGRLLVGLTDTEQLAKLKTVGMTLPPNITRGIILARLAAVSAGAYAWNNYMFPDEEEELSPDDRESPHILMGRQQNGGIAILRNSTSLGDIMEWANLGSIPRLMQQFSDGQIGADDVAKEMAKGTLNKAVQGISPLYVWPLSWLAGQSFFPDVTEPRSVPNTGEHLAQSLGLGDAYKEVMGNYYQDGRTSRGNMVARFLTGVADPRREAVFRIYDLKARFLESKGIPASRWHNPSPTKTMRDAVLAGDFEDFVNARRKYLETGRDWSNFRDSVDTLDPMAGGAGKKFNIQEAQEFENEFLTAKQKVLLRSAREYARKLQADMIKWWSDAEEMDAP